MRCANVPRVPWKTIVGVYFTVRSQQSVKKFWCKSHFDGLMNPLIPTIRNDWDLISANWSSRSLNVEDVRGRPTVAPVYNTIRNEKKRKKNKKEPDIFLLLELWLDSGSRKEAYWLCFQERIYLRSRGLRLLELWLQCCTLWFRRSTTSQMVEEDEDSTTWLRSRISRVMVTHLFNWHQ